MPPAATYTETDTAVPLGPLLDMLRIEGFGIDVRHYADVVAACSLMGTEGDPEMLKYLLAPIICRNAEEQLKFYRVFDAFAEAHNAKKEEEKRQQEQIAKEEKIIKYRKRRWWFIVPMLAVVAGLIVILLYYGTARPAARLKKEGAITYDALHAGRPETFTDTDFFNRITDTSVTNARWYFEDDSSFKEGHIIQHTFSRNGKHKITLKLNAPGDSVTAISEIWVCGTEVVLRADKESPLGVGDSVTITPDSTVKPDSNLIWVVTSPHSNTVSLPASAGSKGLVWRLDSIGTYTFALKNRMDSCELGSIAVSVDDNAHSQLNITPVDPVTISSRPFIAPWPGIIAGILGFGAMAIAIWFFIRRVKPPAPVVPPGPEPGGRSRPFDIPFLHKDHHIQKLLDISRISYDLRKRVAADTPMIDIPRTIHATVRQYGIVTPVFDYRSRPSEYLVLIDSTIAGDPQVQLFGYLIKMFLDGNVLLDVYCYYGRPDKLYRSGMAAPRTLAQLKNDHPLANLILIGNGYNLLHHDKVAPELAAGFSEWATRLLLTPVTVNDWGDKERILSSLFTVLPADIAGWLEVIGSVVTDGEMKLPVIRQTHLYNYSTRFIDFEDIDELEEYIADDDVFQWLCSIAIYHGIRWEIMIELGKKLLSRSNALYKLNYTTLLKLSRIGWMSGKVIPAGIRLDMLQRLDEANELLARETMIGLLSESDSEIAPDSLTYHDKQAQLGANKFVLYANDPVTHIQYKADADAFSAAWEQHKGQIPDFPLAVYLANKDRQWTTPVRSPEDREQAVDMDTYVREVKALEEAAALGPARAKYRRYRLAGTLFSCIFVLCLFQLTGFYKLLGLGGIMNEYRTNDSDLPQTVMFIVKYNDCMRSLAERDSSASITIVINNSRHEIKLDPKIKEADTLGLSGVYTLGLNSDAVSFTLNSKLLAEPLSASSDVIARRYEISLQGLACRDSLDIFISPGEKDDYAPAIQRIRSVYPTARIDLQPRQPGTMNALTIGRQIDSATAFELAQALVRAGVLLRDISFVPGRDIHIAPQATLADKPLLTEKMLKCMLLRDCGSDSCKTAAINTLGLQEGIYHCADYYPELTIRGNLLIIYFSPDDPPLKFYLLPGTKVCGKQATIYVMDILASELYSATAKADDSLIISISPDGINMVEGLKTSHVRRCTYRLLFDVKNYSSNTQLPAAAKGYWAFINATGAVSVTNDSISVSEWKTGSKPATTVYKIDRSFYDAVNGSIIYVFNGGAKYMVMLKMHDAWSISEIRDLPNGRIDKGPEMFIDNFPGSTMTYTTPYRRPRILWVDDHPENNTAIVNEFKMAGISVQFAGRNDEALDDLYTTPFSLVITDIKRDDEKEPNGIELVKDLKNRKNGIPVIIYSASSSDQAYEKEAQSAGASLVTNNAARLKEFVYKQFYTPVAAPASAR